jgi:hypothetical protein
VKRSRVAIGAAAAKLLVGWARDNPITAAAISVAVVGFSILTIAYWGWLGVIWVALSAAYFLVRVLMIVKEEAPNRLPSARGVDRTSATPTRPHQKKSAKQPEKAEQVELPRFWELFVQNFVPALTFIGILLYGILAYSYERFYEALGLEPHDVGLTYGTTLMRSSGFIIEIVVATGLFLFLPAWAARRESRIVDADNVRKGYRTVGSLFFFYVLVVILVPLPIFASRAANTLKSGKPVRPIQYIVPAPMTVLYIRADPVIVRSAVRRTESPAIDRLETCASAAQPCQLFYLGRNDQMAVIYDTSLQRSIHVPLTMVLLERENFASQRSGNPNC